MRVRTLDTARPLQLRHAGTLLEAIFADSGMPADKHMQIYFRTHPRLGMRERGFIAETVYGCLRLRRLLEQVSGQKEAAALVAAYWRAASASASSLASHDNGDTTALLAERLRGSVNAPLPFAIRASLPDWLASRLTAEIGEAEAEALAMALNEPASLDVRVNTLKADRNEVMSQLAAEGFPCSLTTYSPVGLRRSSRAPLFKTGAFKAGLFEVQDEGSQLLAPLLEPKRHERIVDFCAGGGGKTLQIAAMLANTGTIYALDVAAHRLERLKARLRRAGADNMRVQTIEHERDVRDRKSTRLN